MKEEFSSDINSTQQIVNKIVMSLADINASSREACPALACLLGNIFFVSYKNTLSKEHYEQGFSKLLDIAKAYAKVEVKDE